MKQLGQTKIVDQFAGVDYAISRWHCLPGRIIRASWTFAKAIDGEKTLISLAITTPLMKGAVIMSWLALDIAVMHAGEPDDKTLQTP